MAFSWCVLMPHESANIESVDHLLEIDSQAMLSAGEIIKRDYLC
jgi:1-deoxy-D-xylulose-5-phosphate reductoisomerase